MKQILKVIGVLLGALVMLLVVIVWARDGIVKFAAEKAVAAKTGFGLHIKGLHISLLQPGLEITGLKLTNPTDFPEPDALEINKLKISYDHAASTREEVRLHEVTFDLPSVVVVKKINGEMNFKRLGGPKGANQPAPPSQSAPQPPPPPEQKKPAKKVRIDHLAIHLGTVYIRTYVAGEKQPREQKYTMNVEHTYDNVTDFKAIGTQLVLEALLKSSPDALLNLGGGAFNFGKDLGGVAGQGVKQVGGTVQDLGQKLGGALKGILGGDKK